MPTRSHASRRQGGFNLIELIIVLTIIAVLAAIAIPTYSRYSHRARRVDAKELLMRIANAQERFFVSHNRYGNLNELGIDPAGSTNRHYQLALDFDDATQLAYRATARPQGAQADDVCGELSIDNAGRRLPLPGAAGQARCW